MKAFINKLRKKLKDIIKQFEEIFEKYNVPKVDGLEKEPGKHFIKRAQTLNKRKEIVKAVG